MVHHPENPILGVELGNSTSIAVIWIKDKIVPVEEVVSYVSFLSPDPKDWLTGQVAKSCQLALHPSNTVSHMKTLLGRKLDDPEVQRWIQFDRWDFILGGNGNGDGGVCYQIKVGSNFIISPQQAVSTILEKLKQLAQGHLDFEYRKKITDVILAIPPYFTQSQKDALHEATDLAGLNLLPFVEEPVAVVIAYLARIRNLYSVFHSNKDRRKNFVVFDWGGGGLCVSVLEVVKSNKRGEDELPNVEVKSFAYDLNFGGDVIDERLVNFLCQQFVKQHKIKLHVLREDKRAMTRLKLAAEKAKIILSTTTTIAPIRLEDLHQPGLDLNVQLCLKEFNELCRDIFEIRPMQMIIQALEEAGITRKGDVHKVLMVGGISMVKKVREVVEKFFSGGEGEIVDFYCGDGDQENLEMEPLLSPVSYGAAILGMEEGKSDWKY